MFKVRCHPASSYAPSSARAARNAAVAAFNESDEGAAFNHAQHAAWAGLDAAQRAVEAADHARNIALDIYCAAHGAP